MYGSHTQEATIILLDFTQLAYASVAMEMKGETTLDRGLVRHILLDSIRNNNIKFGSKYGELIICCDGRMNWRKEYFPNYKTKRYEKEKKSGLGFDWDEVFDIVRVVKKEIADYLPFKVIEADGAEADDIIAHMIDTRPLGEGMFDDGEPEQALILSGDGDFVQLHSRRNVHQYSPTKKEFVKPEVSAVVDLSVKLATGDSGDKVPNVLSPDDIFITEGVRQSPVTAPFKALWSQYAGREHELLDAVERHELSLWKAGKFDVATVRRNLERNRRLIDLTQQPDNVKLNMAAAVAEENERIRPTLHQTMLFMAARGMNLLLDRVQDFRVFKTG